MSYYDRKQCRDSSRYSIVMGCRRCVGRWNWIYIAVLLVPVLSLSAIAADSFKLAPDGALAVDNGRLETVFLSKDGRATVQGATSISHCQVRTEAPGKMTFDGEFSVIGGVFALDETLTEQNGTAQFQVRLASSAPVAGQKTFLRLILPKNTPIEMDGNPIAGNRKEPVEFKKPRKWMMKLSCGELTIFNPKAVTLQERSPQNDMVLEVEPEGNSAASFRQVDFNVKLQYQPYPNHPLPLTAIANVGFADRTAGDGQGGWSDEGAANDMRAFPAGKTDTFGGMTFITGDPAANPDRGCVALKGGTPVAPFRKTAELELPQPIAANYLYLLHASARHADAGAGIARVTVEFSGAEAVSTETLAFELKQGDRVGNFWNPGGLPQAAVAYRGRNPSAGIGLYLTGLKLTGKPVKKITFEGIADHAIYLLVGATLSSRTLFDEEARVYSPSAGKAYFPVMEPFGVRLGSVLDFSRRLDAPAGKYGFLKINGEQFEFERKPGVPVRFYGANVCKGVPLMGKKAMDGMLDDFAATGYNLIRPHFFDHLIQRKNAGTSLDVDPDLLDNFDYLVAGAKKRGIYITGDLYVSRRVSPGELPGYPDQAFSYREYKALVLIDPGVRENFKSFARTFLNHINPYTGLALKDDPAVVFWSLLNEDTVFSVATASPFIEKLYKDRFEAYLQTEKLNPSASERKRLYMIFLSDLYRKAYLELSRFARESGIRVGITDQNFWDNIGTTLMRNDYDYIDNHFYWSHPILVEKNWNGKIKVAEESTIPNLASSLQAAALTRIYGKPFTVTEWNFCQPNPCLAEGSIVTAAYAGFQNWSALARYCYAQRPEQFAGPSRISNEFFDTAMDPVRSLSERAGILLFQRQDVAPARKQCPILLPLDFFRSGNGDDSYPGILRRLGLLHGVGSIVATPGVPMKSPLSDAAAIVIGRPKDFGWTGDKITPSQISRRYPVEKEVFRSDTGQIVLDSERGVFQVVTDRSEGFVLPEKQSASGALTTVTALDGFGVFFIGSLDDRPLRDSSHLLLLHLMECLNSNMKFSDAAHSTMLPGGRGTSPTLLRYAAMQVTFKRDLNKFRLYAVSLNGDRLGVIPMAETSGGYSAVLRNQLQGHAVLAYELVREE